MAGSLSADDKLLGEKMHYYCSSSDEEYESCNEENHDYDRDKFTSYTIGENDRSGNSTNTSSKSSNVSGNTGPKGVISDWRRFKQLETEKRKDQEKELIALQKKLSITCRSHLDDEKEKDEDDQLVEELEALDDEFMKEYRKQRMEEMRKMFRDIPHFDSVTELNNAEEFLEASENTHPMTTVVIHMYENNVEACSTMNGCLVSLCQDYPTVKFCKIQAHKAKLSSKFSEEGVPALLIYRKGILVGNLVALRDNLGNDFFADDVEKLLLSTCVKDSCQSGAQSAVTTANSTSMEETRWTCAGCHCCIADNTALEVDGRRYHNQCLTCHTCEISLSDESKCYLRLGYFYCRAHYFQRYGTLCNYCDRPICPEDWIRKAEDHCFHLACFICTSCKRQLSTGEPFGMVEHKVYCLTHYNECYMDPHVLSELKSSEKKNTSKRMRTSFTEKQIEVLQSSFMVDCNPDSGELERLSVVTSLSKRVIQVWFQNARARQKRTLPASISSYDQRYHTDLSILSPKLFNN